MYAKSPWTIRERITARGMSRCGLIVSAANAVQLSKPTRMRMAIVDWTATPVTECGRITSQALLNAHWLAPSGFFRR